MTIVAKLKNSVNFATLSETCQSGRSSTLGKRVYRKVTRVRIPQSPPMPLQSKS